LTKAGFGVVRGGLVAVLVDLVVVFSGRRGQVLVRSGLVAVLVDLVSAWRVVLWVFSEWSFQLEVGDRFGAGCGVPVAGWFGHLFGACEVETADSK
jgi:hypothetical protein